ncbi:metallophosphoesterase [Chondromyces apiculatus]|uniref:Calcineurin-like phosphoesterase domain-containing protein n=1 Tax=Chondromyces apiculatus DSM 436 TaxID=1192034 RepID=A0A017T6P8_9BACT|nr:metallophosphoesterase [Chondromyces apiculatus]EYF04899.1 Hypothetical protein CAP_3710 [Chondromyces apiculatus DSM 436]
MQFSLFVTLLTAITGGLAFYVHRRLSTAFGFSPRTRRILGILLAVSLLALPLGRLARSIVPTGGARMLSSVGFLLTLSLLITGVCLALTDLLRLVLRLARRIVLRGESRDGTRDATSPAGALVASDDTAARADDTAARVDDAPARADDAPARADDGASRPVPPQRPLAADAPALALPRRDFLAQGAASAALLAGAGTSLYGALVGRHDYVIEEVAVRIPGLPRSLDGFTLLQFSDIHFGLFIGEREIAVAEDLVRKARGDLVVLTGDLIDNDPAYADMLGRFTRRIAPLTRGGVSAIPGNHDHFAGIDATVGALERGGATVLRNRGQVIGDKGGAFALLGVDDVWARKRIPGGGPDLARALADVPPDLARVLLAHNPVYFPEAAGQVALQLSGHTHGGQVNPVVHPGSWVLPYGYVAGLYQRDGSTLYVNRGFGVAGPPARVNAPPELTRIVLVAA